MNDQCPACIEKRLHTPEDWKHHPLAGHGWQDGHGWTCKEAEMEHIGDLRRLAAGKEKRDGR